MNILETTERLEPASGILSDRHVVKAWTKGGGLRAVVQRWPLPITEWARWQRFVEYPMHLNDGRVLRIFFRDFVIGDGCEWLFRIDASIARAWLYTTDDQVVDQVLCEELDLLKGLRRSAISTGADMPRATPVTSACENAAAAAGFSYASLFATAAFAS